MEARNPSLSPILHDVLLWSDPHPPSTPGCPVWQQVSALFKQNLLSSRDCGRVFFT